MTEMHREALQDVDPDQDPIVPSLAEPIEELVLTGHARIDEALERLEGMDQHEITTHPQEFDAIHSVLRESLASAGRDEVLPDSP